jgi:hypothetical protein
MEEWREYKGYQVSNHGNVKNKNGSLKKLQTDRIGYKRVAICDNGVKLMKVHRLVLLVFIGECPEGYECDHIDRNKENNRLENLRWVTPHENNMNRSITLNMTDDEKRLRHNIQKKESATKRNRAKGMKPKPVGSITKTPSGKFIGGIEINKIRYVSKSLPTEDKARHFINQSVAFDWLKSLVK